MILRSICDESTRMSAQERTAKAWVGQWQARGRLVRPPAAAPAAQQEVGVRVSASPYSEMGTLTEGSPRFSNSGQTHPSRRQRAPRPFRARSH